MVVMRDVVLGAEALLGQSPIPLRRRGLCAIGQVQPADDLPTLPATVGRRRCPAEEIRAVRDVADPRTLDPPAFDLHAPPQRQETPGYSMLEITRATGR